jgi:hypothetical protein
LGVCAGRAGLHAVAVLEIDYSDSADIEALGAVGSNEGAGRALRNTGHTKIVRARDLAGGTQGNTFGGC